MGTKSSDMGLPKLWGCIFFSIDFIVIGLVFLFSSTVSESHNYIFYLLDCWSFIHTPIITMIEPFFVQHVPSHGGGLTALISIFIFYFVCLIYMFFLGFIFGKLLEIARNRITGHKQLV